MESLENLFRKYKICAILRNYSNEQALTLGKCLYKKGIRLFEVAMNTENASFQIAALKQELGEEAKIGAGTVTTIQRCQEAQAAGADFFLTPSTAVPVLEYCKRFQIPLLPGVMTPTDVSLCLEYGYYVMKLFPAGDLPPYYIKSLKGPFDRTEYVAVGGVKLDNIEEYLSKGFIGVGIGSDLENMK